MDELIAAPSGPFALELSYRISPRDKRSFHTPLDAAELLDMSAEPHGTVTMSSEDGSSIHVKMDLPLRNGRILEDFRARQKADGEGLLAERLERTVTGAAGDTVRQEVVDFTDRTIPLPESAYPEVMLPFLLGAQPVDKERRGVYAWINDRFVAHVYYEKHGKPHEIEVPAGKFEVTEVMMYPDLNEWVPMGKVLNKLSKPFVPKYRMWFSDETPRRVIRFEGPYGPPGAPEIVLELAG